MSLIFDNFWIFFRYCLVGVVNTGIHFLILYALVSYGSFPSAFANVCAFLCANVFSYFANSLWSFATTVSGRRYARFLVTSLAGVMLSYGIMKLGDWQGWHYLVSFCIQVALMPVVNFSLVRVFVFSQKNNAC